MRLSDSELILLSEAAKHQNRALVLPAKLKGPAAKKVAAKLLRNALVSEVPAIDGLPIWRRDDDGAALGLIITDAGLTAIHADGAEDIGATSEATDHRGEDSPKKDSAAKAPRTSKVAPASKSVALTKVTGRVTRHNKQEPLPSADRTSSKQDRVLAMLKSKSGTTVTAIMDATGWRPHSVRGFFSGVVRKKLKLDLTSDGEGEERVYRIRTTPVAAPAAGGAKRRTRT